MNTTADEKRQTPYLLMDLTVVDTAYNDFKVALPDVDVHYAMKSNPDRQILAALHKVDASFEIASYAELTELIAVGVAPADVLFSNPVKMPEHIRLTYEAGLYRYAFDSSAELQKTGRVCSRRQRICQVGDCASQ